MARANVVSRLLSKSGLRRAEWWPSAAARGWGTQTSGFRCVNGAALAVRVEYVVGDEHRGMNADQRRQVNDRELSAIVRKLEKRYDVALIKCQQNDRDSYSVGHVVVRDKNDG